MTRLQKYATGPPKSGDRALAGGPGGRPAKSVAILSHLLASHRNIASSVPTAEVIADFPANNIKTDGAESVQTSRRIMARRGTLCCLSSPWLCRSTSKATMVECPGASAIASDANFRSVRQGRPAIARIGAPTAQPKRRTPPSATPSLLQTNGAERWGSN
jgi:hypothetical protein